MTTGSPRFTAIALLTLAAIASLAVAAHAQPPRFDVVISPAVQTGPVTGRLILILAERSEPEPRLTLSPHGPAIFGLDLEQVEPGRVVVVDSTAIGYPDSLAALPPGEYHAQAVIVVYEHVRRADGHELWLPMNDGRIVANHLRAGNLHSEVRPVRVEPGSTHRLEVTRIVPTPPRPRDTGWVKHVTIRSEKLTRFWGRPIDIHATVLLPRGYAENATTRYPTVFTFGHGVPFGFTTDSTRVRGRGQIHPVTGLETGYDFYLEWASDDFPRMIAVSLQQATPYFPDSYSVNSANNGPYGDALIEEVIPYLERRFRMIGKPYARLLEGASTGGWQALALQLRHPDDFGGAWVLQPDPIDFRRYLLTDIYEDANAFYVQVGGLKVERPFRRTVEGQVVWTMRQVSRFEAVLGSRGRSGYQLAGWEAVYGPVGEDGYPRPLWDPLSGEIDREVAQYMRDNGYDLREFAERNWKAIGPKLAGKLHFFAGDMDDFYLNLAVYRFEDFLRAARDPESDAVFAYGRPMKGHSWHAHTWAELVRRMADHVRANTPPGEETTSWFGAAGGRRGAGTR
jgi:hypothetical protein